jgi:acetyl-CoA carboxylase biotin carboxylase subunit
MQLNHQKFIEEAPFLPISSLLNQQVLRDASNIAKHLGLDNVSTIEFLIDEHDRIYFMEINPRIQVEHPLTEMIFDIDIVEQQFLSAMGEHIRIEPKLMTSHGYAIECRINAQNPTDNFMPDCGKISALALPSIDHVRIDTALLPDSVISANYDSLLAKVIVWHWIRFPLKAYRQISIFCAI